jgi:hypothetical protein
MKRVQILLPEELLERVDAAAGDGRRSEFIRGACEAHLGEWKGFAPLLVPSSDKLESSSVVECAPVKRSVAGSIPASPANNVQRYREKIAPVINGSWKTPREISVVTGIHERIVEKMLEGMDVEWDRGAVRLR